MASQHELGPLLHPRSVLVTGLGQDTQSPGQRLAKNLVEGGFRGLVRGLGSNSPWVSTIPSLDHLEEPIEMALITDPFPRVPDLVDHCLKLDIKNLMIYSGGFAESGAEGHLAQSKLVTRVRHRNGRLVGPNSFGVWRAFAEFNATLLSSPQFHPRNHRAKNGVTLLSSSGGLAKSVADRLYQRQVPVSTMIGLGNCAESGAADWLEFLFHDPHSSVVGIIFEGGGGGKRWLDAARQLARQKTVVLLRLGNSASGRQALDRHCALPHTDVHLEDLSAQAGLVVARSFPRFLDQLEIHWKAPESSHDIREIAIFTSSGGAGVLAADAAEHRGLQLVEFDDQVLRRVERCLPPSTPPGNPVDLGQVADGPASAELADAVIASSNIQAAVLILYGHEAPELVRAAAQACERQERVLVAVIEDAPESQKTAMQLELPIATGIEAAMNMLAALAARGISLQRLATPSPTGLRRSSRVLERELGVRRGGSLAKELLLGSRTFGAKERYQRPVFEEPGTQTQVLVDSLCRKVLLEYGLPLLEETRMQSVQELDFYAHEYGYPLIVMLRPSREVLRMSNPEQKARVLQELADRDLDDQTLYLIEPRPRGDRLVVCGMNHQEYGPLVSLRNFRTEVWRLCPAAPELMRSTLKEMGFEENEAGLEALEKLSSLLLSNPPVTRVELNPLVLSPGAATVSGYRMVIRR